MTRARRWLLRAFLAGLPLLLLAAAGEAILRPMVPRCDRSPFRRSALPGVGSELRPGFEGLYKGVEIRVNGDGLRGPELEARPGRRRIALIGDSFTFGTGVALEDTLPRRLEVALRAAGQDVEVINYGVPGHNAENALGMLRGKVLATRPEVVVYTFFANDVQPSLAAAEVVIVDPIDSFAGYPLRSALLQYLGVRAKAALRSFGLFTGSGTLARDVEHFASGGRERAREAVRAMKAACEEQGCALLVLVYPFLTPPDRNPYAEVDRAFARDCGALGVACVPLLGAFDDPARLHRFWVSPFDTHPTGEANERVARYLLQRPEAAARLQSAPPIPR